MDTSALLGDLYQGRFEDLKEIASAHNLPKTGPVEVLRAKLIQALVLSDWDLSPQGVKAISNGDLGELLGVFGIKKSGSIKARRQRLHLHLHHDPKTLTTDSLDEMTKDDLHALCKALELPLSGSKASLLARVAGVLASQENAWGKVKKSLRRPKDNVSIPQAPEPVTPPEPSTTVTEQISTFIDEHDDGWTFEEETALRTSLENAGANVTDATVSANVDAGLRRVTIEESPRTPPMIQHTEQQPHSLEVETALMELHDRRAEVEALSRDFLMVSSTTNRDDMDRFIDSLRRQGFATDLQPVRQAVADMIMQMDYTMQHESVAASALPQSWTEREALRLFEDVRGELRDRLENVLAQHQGDAVKARMSFESEGRELGLDLRIPSVSGRLHALFDLHLEINEAQALNDPVVQRRQRMMRILHRGSVHMNESERRTIDRLERNIGAFEELVQTVLESSEDGFLEAQQALVIRFLESKGYEVNTPDLRPRVLACAGILGAELGYLSPAEIPRIAPGILVSETEVDSIVAELKALASSFKPVSSDVAPDEPETEMSESVAGASDNLERVRGNIDRIDALLNRLNG